MNREGVARVNITGGEHKVKLRGIDYTLVNMDDLRVHWQPSDNRFQRGPTEDRR